MENIKNLSLKYIIVITTNHLREIAKVYTGQRKPNHCNFKRGPQQQEPKTVNNTQPHTMQ